MLHLLQAQLLHKYPPQNAFQIGTCVQRWVVVLRGTASAVQMKRFTRFNVLMNTNFNVMWNTFRMLGAHAHTRPLHP